MLPNFIPVAKKVTATDKKVVLGKIGEPYFKIVTDELHGELAKNALKKLISKFDSVMSISSIKSDGALKVTLKLSNELPEEVTKNSDQAYKIETTETEISLTGYGEAGLYYAVTSLIQALSVENNIVYVPEMNVIDFPDLKTRGHFIETRYGTNLMTLEDWKATVDDMANMKLNQLVISLYGCWCVQYDGIVSEYIYISVPDYPLLKTDVYKKYYSPKKGGWINEVVPVPMAHDDFFGELIAYGKSVGIEILPLWNSYGHNTLMPTKYPEVAPIVNGEKSKVGFCISTPKTYEMLFNIYDLIIDKYLEPNGIKSFHIGLDEVYDNRAVDVDDVYKVYSPWCTCPECSKIANQEKIIQHAIKLITHLKNRGMKNIYIYNDLLSRLFDDPNTFKKALEDNGLLDVTVVDWWAYSDFKEKLSMKTTFPDLKLRSTVKPWNSYYHWRLVRDVTENIYNLSEMAYTEKAEGMQSYASWDKTCDVNHVAIADYSWNHIGTGSVQEFRNNYAKRKFGARYLDGKRAVDLFAKATQSGPFEYGQDKTGYTRDFGLGEFLQTTLLYYGYSYVVANLPYPRSFPGEAMTKLLRHENFYTEKLIEAYSISNEAYNLFKELANDTSCDTLIARRYAGEMRNYRDVVEDYLALLDINRILSENKMSKEIAEKIGSIAKARKDERLSLMAEMENYKEDYLIPSHLRNQSIHMQVFADIEAYVNTTKPEEISLNVCDLRAIGSKIFYDLR